MLFRSKKLLDSRNIEFYYNPFFDVTNSIASAWFARTFLQGDDILIMNGDVFIEEGILDDILSTQMTPVMFADETRKDEADYKFYYENLILKKYGKELSGNEISGEYVGIAKMDKEFLPCFCKRMEEMINSQQHSVWWENVLYSMTDEQDIHICEVKGKFWAEVDYVEDYERITKFIKENLQI